ncbi:hypothetical protein Glove_301g33 [Diversispora epigaea]|uniref:Uncharacterized protein n=1 Tax=Diversispora epigaea TaxID=1348612 RepID=A0A397HW30_9GLOM|nr:hypothetical protein Glove_301g33 [Diversispora epigaea]
MSKKSGFIAILFVICLHVISSLADIPISEIPGPWIITKIAGETMQTGQNVDLEIVSPINTLISVNILQRGSTNNQTLVTDVGLYCGVNVVTVTIPSGNFSTPNPENYFAIYSNGTRIDYTATFQIGDPGFGITISNPVAGDVLEIGGELKAKWNGSYVPPGQDASSFTFVRGLLEPAVISGVVVSFNFFPGSNITFEDGSLIFALPSTIPSNTLYKFGFLITSSVSTYATQIYSSGTFLIV